MTNSNNGTANTDATDCCRARTLIRLMRNDARLPTDIVPGRGATRPGRALLVTGATGFLGRYLVRELLARPGTTIVCLVRAPDASAARERLLVSLAAAGIDLKLHAARIEALVGAVDAPRLGLPAPEYEELCRRIGTIFHCAASVNWARGYRRLRGSNVLGTLELIRLACTGPRKRIYYTSTIAVCFATQGPNVIREDTDMLPYVAQMPLPYAQSKCVAESLLRQVGARGLPVSIIRPALISGDSVSGDANHGDLICALIQGCVAARAAIDSDWQLDCVPVDFVARVLARLTDQRRPAWEVLNLVNDSARHWREIVLWLNLYGYPVQLVSHREWLRRAFDRASAPRALFGYRRFFGAQATPAAGPAPYETYLEHAQGRVASAATRKVLKELKLQPPPLDAALLERYLQHYGSAGLVPQPARMRGPAMVHGPGDSPLEHAVGPCLAERQLTLLSVEEQPFQSRNGIFNELAAARLGQHIGMRRYQLVVRRAGLGRPQRLPVLVKTKPSDALLEDVLVEVATLCEPGLGACCAAFKGDLGLTGSHERELALHELADPRLRRLTPMGYGTHRDPQRGTWSVVMEYLPEAERVDVAATAWTAPQLQVLLRGLASVHAIWYRQDARLSAIGWLPPALTTARMLEMAPVWQALAAHSRQFFGPWLAPGAVALQRELIASLSDWWPRLRDLPQTLIHNDCNPRNLVFRQANGKLVPNIFDWELAAIGVPQHDVAELLCFALPPGCNQHTLMSLLEVHREALQEAAGVAIDPGQSRVGFALSLRYLMLYRLPFYTLMHRFRRQPFLPRVMANWLRLYQLSGELDGWAFQDTHAQSHNHHQYRTDELILRPDPQRATNV